MKQYIGLIKYDEGDNFVIGYDTSSDILKMLKWKNDMLECMDIEDCKIFELTEVGERITFPLEDDPFEKL